MLLNAADRARGRATRLISGPALQLPMYEPDNPEPQPMARPPISLRSFAPGRRKSFWARPVYHGQYFPDLSKNAPGLCGGFARATVGRIFSGRAGGVAIATGGGWPRCGPNTLGGAGATIVHCIARAGPRPLGAAINSSGGAYLTTTGNAWCPEFSQNAGPHLPLKVLGFLT